MKKFIVAAVLLCSVLLASMAMAAGVKTVELGPGVSVLVPEKAPDFQKFNGQILGVHKYSNGNAFVIAECINEEGTVFVALLLAKIDNTVYVVGAVVSYMRDRSNPKTDFLEDVQFMKTGKPSGSLSYVVTPTNFKNFEKYVSATPI